MPQFVRLVKSNERKSEKVSSGFRISVAIPVYNEERVIPELLRRVRLVLDKIPGGPHEIMLVDDGSSDRTFEIVAEAAAQDPRIVAISLSRNFGHQSAGSAALDNVTGDAVVVMDGDLQDSPEVICDFIREYNRGFDVVYAQRIGRKEGWLLRSCYFLFYRLLALFSNLRLPLDSGDFALLSRRVIDELRRLPEHHRYLRGLRAWVGFRQTGIQVERSERFSGNSKYSFMKLLALAFDGIFAFSVVPLRVASIFGLLTILCSCLYATYAIYVKVILGQSPQGFTALIVGITFLSGVQLLFLGVIGEYLGRVYEETKGRPHYIVGKIVGRC
jgi:glycosyltransferase involved in cell wall biosynthesis